MSKYSNYSNVERPHRFDPSYASDRCVCGRPKDAAIHNDAPRKTA